MRFQYAAIDSTGNEFQSTVEAESLAGALAVLEEMGLQVESIQLEGAHSPTVSQHNLWRSRLQQAIFEKQDWLPALDALTEELPMGFAKREMRKLHESLSRDFSADELLRDPKLVDLLPLISRADLSRTSSGRGLESWLRAVVRQRALRGQRFRAWAYPAALFCMAAVLVFVLSWFVIPVFTEMFEAFGLSLPGPTLVLIRISQALTRLDLVDWRLSRVLARAVFPVLVPPPLCSAQFLVRTLWSGRLTRSACHVHAHRQSAELLHLGAPIPDALELAGQHSRHTFYAFATRRSAQGLREVEITGPQIESVANSSGRALPATVILALQKHAMSSKGASGELQSVVVLRELSELYQERTQERTDWISTVFRRQQSWSSVASWRSRCLPCFRR